MLYYNHRKGNIEERKRGGKMIVKEYLVQFRAKHDISQEKLAEILGVSTSMIGRYEKGLAKPHPKNKVKFLMKMKEWENDKSRRI